MTWLDNIIKEAGKGSEETDEEMPKNETLSKELTAEEQAAAKNILDMLSSKQKYDEDLIRKDEARIFESDVPVDINGHENHTNEAVFYQPSTSYTKHVPGVPYAVSDVNWMCNQCTEHKICERHLHDRKPQKTDVSLCSDSHLRMAVYWDISDPENRKKTWRFVIEEKYDRFRDPEQVRSKHDFAANRGGGCKPYEPVHRIKELASRIVQDYNEDQKDKVRVANLDSKGREYYTKPKRWGGKEPFQPSEVAHVRAAYEYSSSNGSRIEAELRVLLQAWYQSKLPQSERGIDRTTANANKIWRENMELQAVDKVAQLAGGKSGFKEKMATLLLDTVQNNANEMKRFEMSSRAVRDTTMKTGVERAAWYEERLRAEKAAKSKARYAKKEETRRAAFVDSVDSSSEKAEEVTDDTLAMFEQMAKDVEDEDKGGKQKPKQVDPITKPKVSKAPREPTAEERELLQKIQDAGEEDAQEEESADPEPEAEIEEEEEEEEEEDAKTETPKSSMPEPKSNKRKATTSISPSAPSAKKSKKDPKPTVTPKPKRKATTPASSEPSAKNSRKSYKSADIIDDSNDEADYDLPSAPALALSEQREGWKILGVVGEGVKVVQTDRKAKIVKAAKADSGEVSVDVVVERGTTIVKEVVRRDTPVRTPSPEPKFPRTAASPAPSHTSSGQSASSASSKKRKTVSWSDDLVEQPEKKRKFSQFYAPGVGQADHDDDLFEE
ncbi:hypothetical protein HBI24_090700 [Parastagonospora nodorum]|nr:hypothetical protein HBH53_038450 [Parastagonospora nodorum]KAH3976387.1 hypothetical protein HBH52_120190 [Parastagonospora nodorum]KAH5296239.1 hypothetical protein HBI11_166390 [Parastagonospora nodorum]KAH5584775.1 hypothetical protein HBI24_090700 [Parastagonospora nodorum]